MAILPVIIALGSAALLVADEDPRRKLAEALEAHRAGRLEEAADMYRAILDRYPSIAEVRSNLGAVYVGLGRYEDAVAEYERALADGPDVPRVRLNLAIAHYKSARLRRAAEELVLVRAAEPGNEQALKVLAECYLNLGEPERVVALLEPERGRVERSKLLSYLLGTAYIRVGRSEAGQALVDRLFRDGESAEALMLLASARLRSHDYAAARDDLAKAVALDGNLPGVHRAYAMALMATGDQAGAEAEFLLELERNPNDFESCLNLAAIRKKERRYERAEDLLAKALLLRPGDFAARYQLATIRMATRRLEEARLELEALVAEAPEFTEARVSLATVYYRLKLKDEGDRQRRIVRELTAKRQARQPTARAAEAVSP